MTTDLARALADLGGVLTRPQALRRLPLHVVDDAVRSGRLVRRFPAVYLDPALAGDPTAEVRVAWSYGRGRAAVSRTRPGEMGHPSVVVARTSCRKSDSGRPMS